MLARGNLVYAAAGSGGAGGGGDLPLMLKLHGFFNNKVRAQHVHSIVRYERGECTMHSAATPWRMQRAP